MRERQQRLRLIRKIIRTERIDSQERLLRHLETEGYSVTQATLSRDLKLLKVGKQAVGDEGYFYTLPAEEQHAERATRYALDLERGLVSVDFSGNLAVVRTLDGHANSVGIALDNLDIDAVLGTVAGDDTVFVALREPVDRDAFVAALRRYAPDLEE